MNTDSLIASLKHHEGKRLRPYKDSVGKTTIGYGHNLEANGIPDWVAEALLQTAIYRCAFDATRVVPSFHRLTDARQEVLVEMVFNLGAAGLAGFVKTLGYIEGCKWKEASAEMLDSKWATQVGSRAKSLSRKFARG